MSRPPSQGRPVQWRPDRRRTNEARLAAFDVLRAVDEQDAYANLAAAQILP